MKINDTVFPAPHRMDVTRKSETGTFRVNSLGERVRDNARMKRIFHLTYKMLPQSKAESLCALLGDGEDVRFTFPDPVKGEMTLFCFCTGIISKIFKTGGETVWEEMNITLEEV